MPSVTLADVFRHTVRTWPKDEFLLVKRAGAYSPISTAGFEEGVKSLSCGLRELGLEPGGKVCLLSENSPDWVMTDFAVFCAGGLTVPIYTTLTPEQIRYIIDDCDAEIVVVSSPEFWKKVAPLRASLPKVRHFVVMHEGAGPGTLTLEAVRERGREALRRDPSLFDAAVDRIRPDDEMTIIYTSGTTGLPKGVVLTHRNFLSNIDAVVTIIPFSHEDTILSFLPLSHVLERMVMFTYISVGATIAFAESVETVAQNLLEIRPTIMVSVPRVFEKIYAKVMDQVLASPGIRRKIFFWALKVGKAWSARKLAGRPIPRGLRMRRAVAAKLVFSKIIEKTGGRVRFFVSGGAPLSKDIAEFFHAIGLVILEGYGLTETAPVLAVNTFEKLRFGTVGPVLPGVDLRIAEDGEIVSRGANVMKGYYKKPAETREALEGGWFHTGDIGHLDPDGFLVITDRKKDLIVTSGGKNVAPQPIENLLKTTPLIESAVVVGDRKRFVSALIVPKFEKLEEAARREGIAVDGRADLVRDPRVVALVKAEVDRATPQLAPYERIKKIALLERDFDIESGEITPTLKVRRNNIEERYRALIEDLYREDGGGNS